MKEKVLVTGAGGLLGTNIVAALIKDGYNVRCLIRKGHSLQSEIKKEDVECVEGDVLDTASLDRAVNGCNYIIHVAAVALLWPRRSRLIWKVNYEGTKNIVTLAKKHNIKKFIYVGTANSFGFGSKLNPGNEENPYTCGKYHTDYMDSKHKAQEFVLEEYLNNGFPAVVINPTAIIGPNGIGNNAIIKAVYYRKIPGYTKGGKCFVHVRDVAQGSVNAITMGRMGQCYIIGGENLSYKEFFIKVSEIVNINPPKIFIPAIFAQAFGLINEIRFIFTKKNPGITYTLAKISCDGMYYSSKKAINELNITQTPVSQAIKESFEWMKNEEYIKIK